MYEQTFEVEHYLEEPQTYEWSIYNPWLLKPGSIIPIVDVHNLTLVIECSTSLTAYYYTWTAQFRHALRAASKIRKLHIELKNSYEVAPFQAATDLVLDSLGQYLKCRGTVTAEMELALGSRDFDSRSYYRMLDGFKG